MPEYKYRCQDCGKITVIRRKMSENKFPNTCPQCDGKNLNRAFSSVGISVQGASLSEASLCCGREAPCNTSPCSDSGVCQRH